MIKEIEATKLSMVKGEVLVITIKSDGIKPADLNGVRDGFRKKFPENDCLVFAVAPNDSVDLSIVSADKGRELSDDSSTEKSS